MFPDTFPNGCLSLGGLLSVDLPKLALSCCIVDETEDEYA